MDNNNARVIIPSKVFGKLAISKKKIFHFPSGIPGLEKERYYTFLDIEEYKPLIWMVSKSGEYHFPVLTLDLLDDNDLDEVSKDVYLPQLQYILSRNPKALVYVILKLTPNLKRISLKAPIIADLTTMEGEQLILDRFGAEIPAQASVA